MPNYFNYILEASAEEDNEEKMKVNLEIFNSYVRGGID